jgi:hypothetical protein
MLPSEPVDSNSGRPFHVEYRDGQLTVYSLGPDGRDGHGDYDPNLWSQGGPDDIGTRAWDVSLRGLPSEGSETGAGA